MFVVGTVLRLHQNPEDPAKFDIVWPVVFENEDTGFAGDRVATRDTRAKAEALADGLNAALQANP
jgi:hypothetical protein